MTLGTEQRAWRRTERADATRTGRPWHRSERLGTSWNPRHTMLSPHMAQAIFPTLLPQAEMGEMGIVTGVM